MTEPSFPKPVEDVVATLIDLYRHQNQFDISEMLESSSARIEQTDYDNWNGGTYSYALMIDAPVSVFASIESRLQEIEKDISAKLALICRNTGSAHLDSVSITPLTSKSFRVGARAKPATSEVSHIWKAGYLRLFLSHVSAHKVVVAKLKSELLDRGISAFVAHEDITPSSEWQQEIELALNSMDALAALLTPDFHESKWTDQEIGFALGRGVRVISVNLGMNPYGFVGKTQALKGWLDLPQATAIHLAKDLLDHASTRRQMRLGLASAFLDCGSFKQAQALSKAILAIPDFTNIEKEVIAKACRENDQVYNAIGVVSRVCTGIGITLPKPDIEGDVPF